MENNVKYWVACSGGVDSVVLTHVMHEMGKPIGILHCNFQLRGEDSLEDERFVKELASSLEVPIKIQRFNVEEYVRVHGGNTQIAARELRYNWFQKVSEKCGGYICLAHHEDDQVETYLLQLSRGAKVKGLASMPFQKGIYLRPLLNRSKNELLDLAKKNKWKWREDRSNISNNYKRNLFRNRLIPIVSREINLKENVLTIVSRYQQLLNLFAQTSFTEQNIYGVNQISLKRWNHLPIILKRMELERFGINKIPVAEVDRLCRSESGAQLRANNRFVLRFRNQLMFVCYPLRQWSYSILAIKNEDKKSFCETIEYADGSKITGDLRSREWNSGDRITPLGMSGSKNINKYLKDQGVPLFYRSEIPVVVDALDRIVFIPGFTVDLSTITL